MKPHADSARVLIADDDPISLHFLHAALTQGGCSVVAVANGTAALAAAAADRFDVLLLDRRMPDSGGVELLAALRRRGVTAPAIATSAEIDAGITKGLRRGGFAEILEKPTSLAALEQALRCFVNFSISPTPAADAVPTALLDDANALAVIGGNTQSLRALRQLLVMELDVLEQDLSQCDLAAQSQQLGERLHRLRASCGFCGTPRLAAAAKHLEHTLRTDPVQRSSRLDEFLQICRQTRMALDSGGIGIA